MSGMLGLQRQRQQLQIGSAEVQKQQQLQGERENVKRMYQTGKDDQGNSILGDDGSPDPAKMLPALGRVAPMTGQQYAQAIIKTHVGKIGLQEASRALDMNHRQALMGPVQSVATGMDPKDAIATMRQYAEQHPEAAPTEKYMEGFVQHIGNAKEEDRPHLAQSIASMMQMGQPVETRPQQATQDVGGQILQGTVAPAVTGGGFTPSTVSRKSLAPSEQIPYRAALTGATSAAEQYAGGASKADVQRANEVRESATNAGRTIQLTQQIDDLFDAIHSGKIAEAASRGAKYLGFASVAEARATLEKDLGQIKGPLAQRAGSDSRAADVLQGYPESSTPAATAHAAMDQVRGMARQDQARFQQLQNRKSNAGFQDADTAYTSKSNPLMHEFMALKPEQRAAFYRRNFTSAQEAQKFKDSVKGFNGG